MLDPDRVDQIAELKARIAALGREQQRAQASWDLDKSNRLMEQIGELDRRVEELRSAGS
jgi:hypothetical protein